MMKPMMKINDDEIALKTISKLMFSSHDTMLGLSRDIWTPEIRKGAGHETSLRPLPTTVDIGYS